MLKAIYNLTTNVLIVTGNGITTFIETIDEMGEWRTLYCNHGYPLYDVQLDFDDSLDETKETELNPNNYNVQYVNLIKGEGDELEMGGDWQNAELTIIKDEPRLEVVGTTNKFDFNMDTATFFVTDRDGKLIKKTKSLNEASDTSVLSKDCGGVVGVDADGIIVKIK